MNILVIGSGGREHALVWKLRQSPLVTKIWCAPGNGGIARDAACVQGDPANVAGLAQLAETLGADLTVVGPEQPLVLGIADEFAKRGMRLLGPSQQCAQLEGSKVFAKEFLRRHAIPTSDVYGVYDSPEKARESLSVVRWPLVLKADGLCGGKGVLVTDSRDEANDFIERSMEQREFGEGGTRMLIEEALTGPELSFIILSDGEYFVPFVPTRDHKRALNNDRGPNTGGMGAYSTDDLISPALHHRIMDTIVRPTMASLNSDGQVFRGFLYFGLMLTSEGPKVLEFNCRLGDPETQALIARMDFDLAEALQFAAEGRLQQAKMNWKQGASLCVVMTSGGYPGKYETHKKISGLDAANAVSGIAVFHAGTALQKGEGSTPDEYYTSGGRVLGVTATGETVDDARVAAYEAVGRIQFSGAHYRTDIASTWRR